MCLDDLPSTFIARLGIVVVVSDIVRAEGAVIVGIRFVIRNGIELSEGFAPPRLIDAPQQLILGSIVSLGFRKRDPVFGMIREAHPKTVSLHPMVSFSLHARIVRTHARQYPAARISGNFVGADLIFSENLEMMPVMIDPDLHAIPFLIKLRDRFAPDMIFHT